MNLGLDAHHLQPYGQTSRSGADRQRHQNRAEHRDRFARHTTETIDMKLASSPGSVAAGRQANTSVTGRLDTHWSRIFYRDALTPDAGTTGERSPLVAGAILLGIYVAIFFAVAGIARVLAVPDAAAAVTASGPITGSSSAGSSSP